MDIVRSELFLITTDFPYAARVARTLRLWRNGAQFRYSVDDSIGGHEAIANLPYHCGQLQRSQMTWDCAALCPYSRYFESPAPTDISSFFEIRMEEEIKPDVVIAHIVQQLPHGTRSSLLQDLWRIISEYLSAKSSEVFYDGGFYTNSFLGFVQSPSGNLILAFRASTPTSFETDFYSLTAPPRCRRHLFTLQGRFVGEMALDVKRHCMYFRRTDSYFSHDSIVRINLDSQFFVPTKRCL